MAHNVITDSEKLGYDDISQNGAKGPASSADNTVAAFDGTTGKLLKDTNISLDSSGDGTKYLNDSGSYTVPADAGGDVVGPSSSVNNTIPQFDGTTGKLLKDSSVVLQTSGAGNQFLAADGTYKVPAGAGDVVGPSVSLANTAALFDGTTGKLLKDSNIALTTTGPGTDFLSADGTYKTPPVGGDVSGPASSTDNHFVVFDGATGKLIKDSTTAHESGGDGREFLSNSGSYTTLDMQTYLASAESLGSQYLYVGEFSNFFFTNSNEAIIDVWGNGDYDVGQDVRQFHYQLCIRKGGWRTNIFIDYHLLNDEFDNENKLNEAIAYYKVDGSVKVYLRAKTAQSYNQALFKITLNHGINTFTPAFVWDSVFTAPAGYTLHNSGGTWLETRSIFATGAASSTDSHIAAFDGATGKLLKDSGVLIKTGGPATEYLDATGNYSVPSGGGGSFAYVSRKFNAATGIPLNNLASFKLIDSNTGSVSSPIKTALPSGGYTLEAGNYYISGVIVFNMHPNESVSLKLNPNIWFTKNTSNFSIRLQQSMSFFGSGDTDGYYSMPFNVDLPGVTEDEFFSINVSCESVGAISGESCDVVQDSYFSIFKV
jgi:hypothetical protein